MELALSLITIFLLPTNLSLWIDFVPPVGPITKFAQNQRIGTVNGWMGGDCILSENGTGFLLLKCDGGYGGG